METYNFMTDQPWISYFEHEKSHHPVVILLHGFLGSHDIWNSFLPEMLKKYRVITVDLPGHGHSTKAAQTFTMTEMAEEVAAIMRKEKVDLAHIIGHSMGGYVGLELLSKFPSKIGSLTLLNSTALDDSEQKKADRLRAIRVFDLNPAIYVREAIQNLFYHENKVAISKFLEPLQEIALGTSILGAQACLRGMRERKNHVLTINEADVPVQFIAGVHDQTVPFDSIPDQVKSSNVSLQVMQNSGHMSFVEEPERCLQLILDFIEQNETI